MTYLNFQRAIDQCYSSRVLFSFFICLKIFSYVSFSFTISESPINPSKIIAGCYLILNNYRLSTFPWWICTSNEIYLFSASEIFSIAVAIKTSMSHSLLCLWVSGYIIKSKSATSDCVNINSEAITSN